MRNIKGSNLSLEVRVLVLKHPSGLGRKQGWGFWVDKLQEVFMLTWVSCGALLEFDEVGGHRKESKGATRMLLQFCLFPLTFQPLKVFKASPLFVAEQHYRSSSPQSIAPPFDSRT